MYAASMAATAARSSAVRYPTGSRLARGSFSGQLRPYWIPDCRGPGSCGSHRRRVRGNQLIQTNLKTTGWGASHIAYTTCVLLPAEEPAPADQVAPSKRIEIQLTPNTPQMRALVKSIDDRCSSPYMTTYLLSYILPTHPLTHSPTHSLNQSITTHSP